MNNNPLTNQTYINKDFQTIYPELLDLVKKLTHKWDPTISNESDPGVLLIKLNAIIADKNNYNIDKNILECFPDTVTQYDNAFKLFAQLGYNMRWYKSASGTISFIWDSDPVLTPDKLHTIGYNIPQFTMISDTDKEIVYTTIQKATVNTDGTITEVPVLQGVIRDYSIGSRTLIKPSMLDYRNRLYFPIRNVAENGIFISDANRNGNDEYEFIWYNPDVVDFYSWKRVDNLNTQAPQTKCYKFGVDQSNNSCYLEFPDDITDIMGEGIQIKYLQSDGASGNVAAGRISKFYEDLTVNDVDVSGQTKVVNYSSITNGQEPEDIQDAYAGYQKTIGTFDTLVTLRDYLNYIVNDEFEESSNGVVTDRTNDVQCSYGILSKQPDNENISVDTVVETVVTDNGTIPQMYAYDLKTYLLEYSQWPKFTTSVDINTQKTRFKEAYDKSFRLKLSDGDNPLDTSENIKKLVENAKTISHDFKPKLPYKILMIKNKFKLSLTIIPNDTVSQAQADDIEINIYENVLKRLHSSNVSFGEEITYEMIYDLCNTIDNRVKAVALDNIEYVPYAVVYVPEDADLGEQNTQIKLSDVFYNVEDENGGNYTVRTGLNEIFIPSSISGSGDLTFNERLALEICSKNIAKGTTPLYFPDNSFQHTVDQINVSTVTPVSRISTDTQLEFRCGTDGYSYMYDYENSRPGNETESELLPNEALFLYAPSLIDDTSWEASIKYTYITDEYYSGNDVDFIPANRDYVLQRGQHLFMFWKVEDATDAPYLYHRYGEGTILKSTTKLIKYKNRDTSEYTNYNIVSKSLLESDFTGEGQIFGELNEYIGALKETILSVNKSVTIKRINSKELTNINNYCYWITNNIVPNNNDDFYEITFDYVNDSQQLIDRSFNDGHIYISNFEWSNSSVADVRVLGPKDKLIILQPIKETLSYNAKNTNSGQVYVNKMEVYNYKVIAKLQEDDEIQCTGNIYPCDATVVNSINNNYKIDDTILWGTLEQQITEPYPLNIAFNTIELQNPVLNVNGVTNPPKFWESYDTDYIGTTYLLVYEKNETTGTNGWSLKREDGKEFGYNTKQTSISIETEESDGTTKFEENGYTILETKPDTYKFKLGDYFRFTLSVTVDEKTYVDFYTHRTVGDNTYSIPVSAELCGTIEQNPQWVLSNGYKIDKLHTRTTKSYGPQAPEGATSKFEYLLKTGEMFIYAFEDKKGMEILENGTKVVLTIPDKQITAVTNNIPNSLTFTVPVISADSIQEDGMDAFMDRSWHNFICQSTTDVNGNTKVTSGTLVTLVENQIKLLGEGVRLRIQRRGIDVPTFNSDTMEFGKTTIYDDRLKNLRINSDGVFVASGNSPADDAWYQMHAALSNYIIQYNTVDDRTWVDIPESEGKLSWDAYTILNINAGPTTPQVISGKHNQCMSLHRADGSESTNITNSGKHIQTNVNMNISGGHNVDVTRLNSDGETKFLTVTYYDKLPLTDSRIIYSTDNNGDYLVELPKSDPTLELGNTTDRLGISNNTILQLEMSEIPSSLSGFTVKTTTATGDEIEKDSLNGEINGPGVYYYPLSECVGITFTATFSSNATDEDKLLFTLKPLFKYYSDSDITDEIEEDPRKVPQLILENYISTLDVNHNFYYTNFPKEDTKIPNPLNPKSYFNVNHKYNKFTIPQVSTVNIKVLNKR